MYAQSHAVGLHWTQLQKNTKKAYTKINSCAALYVERYKIIATPMNSNKFTEFDMKK